MTIGVLARCAGVNVETIRYYQRRGMLPQPERSLGQVRRYGEESLQRIAFIKRAQRLGFTLDEIGALLALNDGTGCRAASAIAEKKLAEVEGKLRDLEAIRATLAGLVGRCRSGGRVACPLISALANSEAEGRPRQ